MLLPGYFGFLANKYEVLLTHLKIFDSNKYDVKNVKQFTA